MQDFNKIIGEGAGSVTKSAYNYTPSAAATPQSPGQGAKKRSFRTDVAGTQN
jgi:hypothetical protein